MKLISQFSKREKFLLFATVAVIVIAVSINFFVTPVAKRWRRMNNQISNLYNKLSRYTNILTLEKEIETKYKTYADYLKVKGSSEEALASVLQEIEKLARTSGVAITNIVPSGMETKDFYNKFEVRMDVESEINSLVRFLYELQSSKHLFRVVRLNINTKAGTQDVLRSSIQLIKIFI
ncbi:MAG: type II secretion system protein M [Candidatus Omnitrophica bacterium]|nr:type II secretion system protein M [Candidatus Omnitrophota bacterium]